jgi:hypothetical protein
VAKWAAGVVLLLAAVAAECAQLVVRHDGYARASLRVAPDAAPIVVRLSKGGMLRGRVVKGPARVNVENILLGR